MMRVLVKFQKAKIGNILLKEFQKNVNNCKSLEISSAKKVKIIHDSVEYLTIFKKLYDKYYNQIGIGLSETLRNLLPDELIEIDKDLRQNLFLLIFITNIMMTK